jgi:hypothetical protein
MELLGGCAKGGAMLRQSEGTNAARQSADQQRYRSEDQAFQADCAGSIPVTAPRLTGAHALLCTSAGLRRCSRDSIGRAAGPDVSAGRPRTSCSWRSCTGLASGGRGLAPRAASRRVPGRPAARGRAAATLRLAGGGIRAARTPVPESGLAGHVEAFGQDVPPAVLSAGLAVDDDGARRRPVQPS